MDHPTSSGRGEKRDASFPPEVSWLFKRGGPKATRAFCDTQTAASHRDDGGSLRNHPNVLDAFKETLNAMSKPLQAQSDNVTVCVWDPKKRVAKVVRARGKHLTKMGFNEGANQFLRPEEVLFLVETERAVLFLDDVVSVTTTHTNPGAKHANPDASNANPEQRPMSLRRAHRVVAESGGVSNDAYLLYAFLVRRGYVVRRFAGDAGDKTGYSLNTHMEDGSARGRGTWCDAALVTENTISSTVGSRDTALRGESIGRPRGWYPSAARWLGTGSRDSRTISPTLVPVEVVKQTGSTATTRSLVQSSLSGSNPLFAAFVPDGNTFSKKNPGAVSFYVFLKASENGDEAHRFVPSCHERRGAAKRLTALGEQNLETKIAWATVADGVVVLHRFNDF